MNKSDRAPLFFFLIILAIIFMFLFYIFDGDTGTLSDKTKNTYIEDEMLDEDDEEDLDKNIKRYKAHSNGYTKQSDYSSNHSSNDEISDSSSSKTYQRSSGAGSGSLRSTHSSERKKYQTAFFEKYYKKPLQITPTQKRQKVRNRLKKKGFVNEEYIEMKAYAASNYSARKALKLAQNYANKEKPEKAIELLEDQLSELNPKDLRTRGQIQQALITIYSNFGYPDKWQETVQQNVALRKKILNIQKNTILADNPRYQDTLAQQEKMLGTDLDKALEGLPVYIQKMKENKGTPPEMKNAAKAALLNMTNQTNGKMSIKDVSKSYKDIEALRSKHWANPK